MSILYAAVAASSPYKPRFSRSKFLYIFQCSDRQYGHHPPKQARPPSRKTERCLWTWGYWPGFGWWASTLTSSKIHILIKFQKCLVGFCALSVSNISPVSTQLSPVVLQGYMYLTNSYMCFFAHMPSREVSSFFNNSFSSLTASQKDQILKSGSLNKRAQRTKRWIKHWFILKNDALSWYQSSSVRSSSLPTDTTWFWIQRIRIFHMVSLTFAMQSLVSPQAIRISVYELARRRWYYLQIPFLVEKNGLKLSEKLYSKPKTWVILLKYLIFCFMHTFSFLTSF